MLLKLFIANLKSLFRNKQSLFWTIAFPLIFTVIFGFFFGSGSLGTGSIALVNQSNSALSQGLVKSIENQSAFKVNEQSGTSDLSDQIQKGTVGAALVIPPHFGDATAGAPTAVTIIYDPGSIQTQAALEGFVNAFLTQASFQALGSKPLYTYVSEKADTQATFAYFDFVLVGLIGMALMNSAITGLAVSMAHYKESQILKRITTTPLPSWIFIAAEVLSRLVLNLVQIGLILGIGVKFFHAHIGGNWTALILIALLGAILFQLLGFFVATMSKNTDTAQSMSQAITVPMMFLSGVFFPIDQLPNWLYSIVKFLPLSPLLRSMRSVALENGTWSGNASNLALVGAWIVILLILAIYRFRMNQD